MPSPIRQQVMDDIKTTLASISTGGGYYNDVTNVVRGSITPTTFKVFPAIAFDDTGESYDRLNNHILGKSLNVTVLGLLKVHKDTGEASVRAAASELLADIETALMVDRCRGGVATDTLLIRNDIQSGEAISPLVFVLVELTVKYRTNLSDPETL